MDSVRVAVLQMVSGDQLDHNLAQAEALVIEDNVVEWVVSNAKTSDVATSFDDLMGNAA